MAIIVWLFFLLLAKELECKPATNSSALKSNGLPLSEKLKMARYAYLLLVPFLGAIGGTIVSYFVYKNTSKVANNLMGVSEQAYNVTVGSLKNAYCWSSNILCSSLTCCCSQRGCFWCCRDRRYGSCCMSMNEEDSQPIIVLEPIVKTENSPPISDYNYHYQKILEKSTEVDIYKFLELHQSYSGTPACLSHTTYCGNETCIDKKHINFEKWGGIALEPFIYYLVLDWSYLRYQKIDSNATAKDLFKLIFRREFPYQNVFDNEWDDMIRTLKLNVFITLVNFPEVSYVNISRETDEGRLLLLVVELYKELRIHVGNLVKSSLQVDEKSVLDDGSKECRLSLTTPLKTFPLGRDLTRDNLLQRLKLLDCDESEQNQIINGNQTGEFFDLETTENRISKIVLKNIPSQTQNLVCRIYLGDERETSDGRTWNKVPYIESPKINFETTNTTTPSTNPTTSSGPSSVASTSTATSSTDDDFIFTDEDGGNLKLFSTTVHLLKAKEQRELGGLLDSDLLWRKVGEKIFEGVQGGKKEQLDDIQDPSSGCGLKFLETLKANKTGNNMSWSTFLDKCEQHKVYGIKDALTEEENEQFKNSVVALLDLKYRENIGRKLDILSRWKILADHEFGITQFEFTTIQNSRKPPGSFSQTEYLLLLIWQTDPDTTLKSLARACWDVGMKNAYTLLKRIGSEKKSATES